MRSAQNNGPVLKLRFLFAGCVGLAVGGFVGCYPSGYNTAGTFYCVSNSDCPTGQFCDANSGQCGSSEPGSNSSGNNSGNNNSGGFDAGNTNPPPPTMDAGTSTTPPPNSASYCKACQQDSDCGSGGYCLENQDNSGSFCGSTCNSDADCPSGGKCWPISDQSSGQTVGNNCFPANGICPGGSTPPPPPPPAMDAGTPKPDAGSSQCTPDTYSNYAAGFFQTNCDYCHGHSFGSGYSNFSSRKSSVQSYISQGYMPPGGGLNPSDQARILKWISCGAPQ